MSTLPADSSTAVPDETAQDQPSTSSAQHSRSSSMQSTATNYDGKDGKVPDLVRRDMEFFMARLTRTASNDSTGPR